MRKLVFAGALLSEMLLSAGVASAGNTSTNTSNNSSNNSSSDPWSSNSSSNSSDNSSGWRGRIDDFRRDERRDRRGDWRYRRDLYEEYWTEDGGWVLRRRERGGPAYYERDDD